MKRERPTGKTKNGDVLKTNAGDLKKSGVVLRLRLREIRFTVQSRIAGPEPVLLNVHRLQRELQVYQDQGPVWTAPLQQVEEELITITVLIYRMWLCLLLP